MTQIQLFAKAGPLAKDRAEILTNVLDDGLLSAVGKPRRLPRWAMDWPYGGATREATAISTYRQREIVDGETARLDS